MRTLILVSYVLCLFITAAANAFVLSFDTSATGMIEMAPDDAQNTTCISPDICSLSLTFTNIGGSGVSATIEGLLNMPPDVFPTSLWYDVGPGVGGMGAATVEQATDGHPDFDPGAASAIGLLEIILVTFSEPVAVDAFWMNGGDALLNETVGIFVGGGGPPLEAVDCVNSFCDSMAWTGTSFAFSASPDTPYYLAGVSFTPAPIPVPAAIWLFASALGFLGLFRRR